MQIDYFLETIVNGTLEVENPFTCAIEANDDLGNFYYLLTKTEMGITNILEFGPVSQHNYTNSSYQKFKQVSTTDTKLKKVITEFLNNDLRKITQAKEISLEEAYEKYPSLLEEFKKEPVADMDM